MIHADLHTHTTHSDGGTLAWQNVRLAVMRGLEAVAIADHDSLAGISEAQEEAKKWGIKVVPAVEITTPHYHILGYNFTQTKDFEEFVRYSRECQNERTAQKIAMLQEQGYTVSMELVRELSPADARIGTQNLVYALKQTDLRGRSRREISAMVRALPKFDSAAPSVQDAVNAIHAAGGIAVFAHPPRDAKTMEDVEAVLATGIDGIEIQPNFYNPNLSKSEIVTYPAMEALAKERGLLLTTGSDYHGPEYEHRPMLKRGMYPIEKFW